MVVALYQQHLAIVLGGFGAGIPRGLRPRELPQPKPSTAFEILL